MFLKFSFYMSYLVFYVLTFFIFINNYCKRKGEISSVSNGLTFFLLLISRI
jgi:hypothetical protein